MTDFNAFLDGTSNEEDQKKKKFDITPTAYKQNKTTDFNAFLDTKPEPKKTVTPTPTVTQPTATPTPPKKTGTDFGSILNNITDTIKNALVKAIPQLGSQPTIPTSTVPSNLDLKTVLDQTKNLPKTTVPQLNLDNKTAAPSAQLSEAVTSSPQFIANQQKTINIIDSVLKFNPIDYGITKGQEYLSKEAQNFYEGKTKGVPLVYTLSFYQKLTEPLFENKVTRAFVRSESKAILGSSQKIQDLFNTKLDKPQNIGETVAYTGVDMLVGLANLFVGGKGLEAIGVAKNMVLPTLFTTLGQLGAPPSTTVQQRLAKAPVDMITGWLFNLVPGSEKLFSLKTLKGMGLVAGATAPTSFISYLIEGLSPKEAAIEALKATAINAAFHSVMVAQGIAGKKLFGESKSGTTVLTPDQAITQATGTNLSGTKAGSDLNDIALKAQAEGKNIQIEVVAVKQGAVTKMVGTEPLKKVGIEVPTIKGTEGGKIVETPNGVAVRYTLVDQPAPIQQLRGEKPQPKTTTEIATIPQELVKTPQGEAPAVSPATPNNLNIKGLDPLTNTKIEELNQKDIANPAEEGKVRVYQAVAKGQTTDYVFKTPEELANFKNNVTSENEQFKYIDINPNELKAVEGKKGVFQITQPEPPKPAVKLELNKEVPPHIQKGIDLSKSLDQPKVLNKVVQEVKPYIDRNKTLSEFSNDVNSLGQTFGEFEGDLNFTKNNAIVKLADGRTFDFKLREIFEAGRKATPVKEKPSYERGQITETEKQLDQLLGTEQFNFTGSWKNKLAARNTALSQLEYYTEQGDQGAKDTLAQVNKLSDKLIELRAERQKGYSGTADIGGYSNVQSATKMVSGLKALEFPEILRITKDLLGKTPTLKKFPRARGMFYGNPLAPDLKLHPEIFKEPGLAAKVLAHELGHLTDFLPDKNLKRGNLVGRIASLNSYLKDLYGVDENGEISNKVVRSELKALTQLWKPFDETKVPASFKTYRYSAIELYADAISVLYNDPDLLKEKAPEFYKDFFNYIDRKPDVKETFFAIQDLLNRGQEAVLTERDKELNEMFQKGEDLYKIKREEYKKKQTDLLFRLKYDFVDKNQKAIDYVNSAKKRGEIIPDEDNPQYWLEEWNYVGGVLKNFAETKIQPIYEELNKNDISWADFGKYLFLDRVINERGEFANPLGYDPKTAKDQIDFLKKDLGEKNFNILVDQANKFRDNIKSLLDPAKDVGIYDPAVVEKLKLNPAYATFQVLDYLDDYIPASIKKQVGTLKEIANPADAMVLKTMSLLRAIEKNKVKTKMVDFIKKFETKEIEPAKTRWTGRYHEPLEPKDLGKGLITVMKGGKIEGYYVDEYIAKIFDTAGTGNINAFIRFMSLLNGQYFRPVFTTFNTGFQSFNLFRDFFRYWKNQPALNILDVLGQYKKALPHAYNRAFGKYDEIVAEMEKSKILSVTMNDLLGGAQAEEEEKQIEFALRKAGLSPMNDTRKGILKPIFTLLDTISNVGNLIESLPKISAYLRYQDEMTPKELGHFIRTMAGSPDFLRKGAGYYGYNNVFLFSNAIKEGFRADFEASVKNPKTRTGWWLKTFIANVLPKLFMFTAALGAFGLGMKRMMDKVTEYDKTNYIVIPLGEDDNGQAVYMRVPQDETGRFVSGLFWKMLNIGNQDQTVMKNVSDIFSFMGGQAPNLNPLITVGSAVFQFGIGQNPYDWQKGKNVIPDTNFKAGGKYALIPFIKWLSDSLGGGIIYRFNVTQKAPESQTWVEKLINAPILSNILGRWIRVTDYGVQESLSKQEAQITAQQAARTIEKKALIKKYAQDFRKNPSQGLLNVENQLVRDAFQLKGVPTTAQKQGIAILRKQFRVAVATGQNTYIDSYFYANTNEAKLVILKEMKANTDKNKFREALKALKAQGLISNEMITNALRQ